MQEIDTPTRNASQTSRAQTSQSEPDKREHNHEPATSYAPRELGLLASALLVACGGDDAGSSSSSVSASAPGFNNFPQAANDSEAARFLQQSQFASTPSDIASVRSTTFSDYLQQQFSKPINTGWDWLESRGYGRDATLDKYVYSDTIADCMVWRDLFSAPDAMRKRVSLALSEFFVVSFGSMEIDWRGYAITAFWDMLNKHAFGNFRQLLEDVSLSPAMGFYLNTRGNKRANTAGRQPDENYAREVMQLFTIGLYELNLDGSIKLDASGKRRETYTSDDVTQLARVFTGYDFDRSLHPYETGNGVQFPGGNYKVWPREYARRPMTIKESDHSPEEVKFLGTTIAANTLSARKLKTALDTLFNHPNVGPFFGRQMIQRLVTSDPSPEYVARVASAFNNNGAGVRGDMKAVWTAIMLDDEARSSASLSDPFFGKLREPMVRLTQWARTFNAVSKAGSWKIFDLSDVSFSLGQSPFHAPSVFNYFRPGYIPPGTTLASSGATAPEFQIVNETTVGSYLNYMQYVIQDGMYTFDPDTPEITYSKGGRTDVQGDYANLMGLINNTVSNDAEAQRVSQALANQLNLLLTAGQLSAGSLATIASALKASMLQSDKQITSAKTELKSRLVAAGIFMVMASPDYLIQK